MEIEWLKGISPKNSAIGMEYNINKIAVVKPIPFRGHQ
jgi:hypothetical protein